MASAIPAVDTSIHSAIASAASRKRKQDAPKTAEGAVQEEITSGFRRLSDADALLVVSAYREIQASGREVTAEALWESARPAASPIHHLFEWDAEKALREIGIHRAHTLLRAVVLTVREPETKTYRVQHYFDSLPREDSAETDDPQAAHHVFMPLPTILSDSEMRAEHLRKWLRNTRNIAENLRDHIECSRLMDELDRLCAQHLEV